MNSETLGPTWGEGMYIFAQTVPPRGIPFVLTQPFVQTLELLNHAHRFENLAGGLDFLTDV